MIPKETIDLIFETARIEEVVGDFVTLKKRGVNLLGNCPFHSEKTPSFTVSPAKGIYKCFGCGKAGSSVNFIMDHEHLTYPEALRYLADKYRIAIEEEVLSDEKKLEQSEKESLYVVSNFAENYFTGQLWNTDEGKSVGLSYFKERGFSDATIKKFKLGYSPSTFDHFSIKAREEGYQVKYLVATGLSKEKEGKLYDGYRGRVIFPIHNISGRAIAFGGRTLKTDKTIPKYINSPENEIYHKSNVLYGLYFAKAAIIKNDNCFLVEGYTDVVSLHQSGIENVVASSGTSLTEGQIRLISRYTKNITILYDGDSAGIKASFRGIDMILKEGMNVKVVLFPDGDDPDSYAKKHDTDEINTFIAKESKDFIRFKISVLLEEASKDPIKKAGLIREIVESVSFIPDPIIRSVYIKECSVMMEVAENILVTETNKLLRSNYSKKLKEKNTDINDAIPEIEVPAALKQQEPSAEIDYQEREIIRLLLTHGDKEIEFELPDEDGKKTTVKANVAAYLCMRISENELTFHEAAYERIYNEYLKAANEGKTISSDIFIHSEDAEVCSLAVNLLLEPYELHRWQSKGLEVLSETDKLKSAVEGALHSFMVKKIHHRIVENQKKLKETLDPEEQEVILQEQIKLIKLKSEISGLQGRVITN